ncbi:MAG: hypothetical protein NTY64_17095, partial [Deltaproteobacteria bacterium]|nr:hypothetical protein [Deltaproteobacteria bacterium]
MRCILRRCGVLPSTPLSSGFTRLASGAFYFAIKILTFYEIIKIGSPAKKVWAPPTGGVPHPRLTFG